MSVTTETSVAAIRADFRRISRGSMLQRVLHAVASHRERAADRAAARSMLRLEHPGVLDDDRAARRFR